ncbi:helix-turn-helix domain-containing protein [Actinomycetospora atypica]|uniref:Helix-turn-helix domain-containing protein n=1 Tax=Actinomycetospora atypica TaxID=1290095 RepID=A0ABV9YTG1_9PSEU
MTDDPTPTTLRRQLGAQLRELRQAKGKTAAEVARDLQFSVSKISRMESGARAVSEPDIAALIAYYGVAHELAEALVETARAGRRRRDAWVDVASTGSDFQKFVQSGFVELERDADFIREFNSGVVPGLLQTKRYMQAMMDAAEPTRQDVVDKAIELRLSRQGRLAQTGRYSVIIDEAALARVVGGASVMAEQLGALGKRMDTGAVDARIIPFTSGFHPGLNSVFIALTMGGPGVPDAVFIEGLIGFQKFDGADEVARFEHVWQELLTCAASESQSRALVEARRSAYEGSSR